MLADRTTDKIGENLRVNNGPIATLGQHTREKLRKLSAELCLQLRASRQARSTIYFLNMIVHHDCLKEACAPEV